MIIGAIAGPSIGGRRRPPNRLALATVGAGAVVRHGAQRRAKVARRGHPAGHPPRTEGCTRWPAALDLIRRDGIPGRQDVALRNLARQHRRARTKRERFGCLGVHLLRHPVAVRPSRRPPGAPDAGAGVGHMTVLVTGGTGFVGLNVVERLAAEGYDIVALGHAAPPWHLPEPTRRRAEIVVGDVRSVDALEEALAGRRPKRIVHAAAMTPSPERERDEPDQIASVNLGGTIAVLQLARRFDVERVVVLSSVAVYGAARPGTGPSRGRRERRRNPPPSTASRSSRPSKRRSIWAPLKASTFAQCASGRCSGATNMRPACGIRSRPIRKSWRVRKPGMKHACPEPAPPTGSMLRTRPRESSACWRRIKSTSACSISAAAG